MHYQQSGGELGQPDDGVCGAGPLQGLLKLLRGGSRSLSLCAIAALISNCGVTAGLERQG